MSPSKITLLGNPVLRARAAEINDPRSPEVTALSADLHAAMLEIGLVGLAAPQIGVSLRVFVMQSRKGPRYPNAPEIPPITVINPDVISQSEAHLRGIESCGSIPGFRGLVSRPASIRARWLDLEGRRVEMELIDLAARVFLHELDHLDGILFLDRLASLEDLVMEAEIDRLNERLEPIGQAASEPDSPRFPVPPPS